MSVARARAFFGLLLLVWILAAAGYCYASAGSIGGDVFPDPDDALRRQQVRDWLAGQAWGDVSQHRLNTPWGAPMHWSRIVDIPIAIVTVLLRPLLGVVGAERATAVTLPLLTMLVLMVVVGVVARRLLPPWQAFLAAALVPLTIGAMLQLRPMRIDHHGWQMVMAAAMLAGALLRDPRRGGLLSGAAAALWLGISLEGLPLAGFLGVWLALGWLRGQEAAAARLQAFALALGVGILAVFAIFRTAPDPLAVACDGVTIVQVAAIVIAACGICLSVRLTGRASLTIRFAALGTAGVAAAATYLLSAPQCVFGGAFADLDPLARHYWLRNVLEGEPIWDQPWTVAVATIASTMIGLAGTWLAWRRFEGEAQDRWETTLALLAFAFLLSLLVQRTGAVAQQFALPGGAFLIVAAFEAAQRIRIAAIRVPATVFSSFVLLPPTAALIAAGANPPKTDRGGPSCATNANLAKLSALPTGRLLTGIDTGPGVLVSTAHSVVASGHHRNHDGMRDAITFFVGTEQQAHAIARARGLDYVAVCPLLREFDLYREGAPHGFWMQLERGRAPAWLKPVEVPGSTLAIWKVVD